jgi:hypothetical protein
MMEIAIGVLQGVVAAVAYLITGVVLTGVDGEANAWDVIMWPVYLLMSVLMAVRVFMDWALGERHV